jgi:hypothetical protein
MEFNILKTRRGKLHDKINAELAKNEVDIGVILNYVDQYEKDNLETIEKLKRLRTLETKKINGALKQTINVHGPITKILIGSATKRIYGALLVNEPKENIIKRLLKWIKI